MIPVDKYTLGVIATLHPKLRYEARTIYDEIRAANLSVRFTSGFRSFAEQQKIYNQGRTTPGPIVSNAKPGTSFHNYGLALDFAILTLDGKKLLWDMRFDGADAGKEADWAQVVAIFTQCGWEWGGRWKFVDNPHFQRVFGLTVKEAKARYDAKKLKDGYIIL